MFGIILVILIMLVFAEVLPMWGHRRSWGYYPSGRLGVRLKIVVILLLIGRV